MLTDGEKFWAESTTNYYPWFHGYVDENTNIEMEVIDKILFRAVLEAMSSLSEEENWLIQELFFYGQNERELSRQTGIPRKTISYRKEKALIKIRKFIKI